MRREYSRRNLLVGVGLGLAGMAGLWGIGFFSPELISTALKGEPQHVVDTVAGVVYTGYAASLWWRRRKWRRKE